MFFGCFFFNDPATTEIYTLSLHDAFRSQPSRDLPGRAARPHRRVPRRLSVFRRSEEHTSELQSRVDLVCRLLLEKKKSTAMMRGTTHRSSCKTSARIVATMPGANNRPTS